MHESEQQYASSNPASAGLNPDNPGDSNGDVQPPVESAALRRWLQAAADTNTLHPDLSALQAYASARLRCGKDWEMPPHLSECPMCLAVFETLLERPDSLPSATRARFIGIFGDTTPRVSWFQTRGISWLKKAALFAVVAGGAVWLYTHAMSRAVTPGELDRGRVVRVDSRHVITTGEAVVSDTLLETTEPAVITLKDDGSRLTIDTATRFSIVTDPSSGSVVTLVAGRIAFDIQPQSPDHKFKVRTSMGGVDVVGTHFSVDCRSEDVTAFENQGGGQIPQAHQTVIASVVVVVNSGKVRVFNEQEEVMLTAGRTATLRNNTPMIEVFDGSR